MSVPLFTRKSSNSELLYQRKVQVNVKYIKSRIGHGKKKYSV